MASFGKAGHICNCDGANEKADASKSNELENKKMMLEDIYSKEEAEAISTDVAKLSTEGIVDEALCDKLKFEKVNSTTIPLFEGINQ